MVVCPVSSCSSVVLSTNALQIHLRRQHGLCPKMTSVSYSCSELKCGRCFSNWKTYRQHLVRFHSIPVSLKSINNPSVYPSPLTFCPNSNSPGSPSNDQPSDLSNITSFRDNNVSEISSNTEGSISSLEQEVKSAAMAMFKELYAISSMPRSQVQTVVEKVNELLGICVSKVRDSLRHALEEKNVSMTAIKSIDNHFQILQTPFNGLCSEYFRFKELKADASWIEPEDIVVGDAEDLGPGRVEPVSVKASYISLKEKLTVFFERPGVFNSVISYIDSLSKQPEGQLTNFIQGQAWKKRIEGLDGYHFPLFLFCDDFQVNNPLGSHCENGKLGGVYVSIPVLPPELRSGQDSIFIVELFKSFDRTSFGNEAIFCHLVDELEYLQTIGLVFNVEGTIQKVNFHLGLIIGDNLGLNSMMDFVSSFSANYCCRHCKIHKHLLHYASVEDEVLIRNKINYDEDVLINDVSLTGIVKNSIWNRLPGFHVTSNFCVDFMHDVLEGSCNYDLSQILSHFIKEKFISIDALNFRIRTHAYGSLNGENAPPCITEDALKKCHLRMTAHEMLVFVRSFSLIVGDLIPPDDPCWRLYLLLRKIIDVIMSPVVNEDLSVILNSLVREHNELYVVLFGTLKPKHHFLVHYGRIMLLVGPIIHIWCMRFEAKHRGPKAVAKSTQCRKNILKTLSMKEQLIFSARNLDMSEIRKIGKMFIPDFCVDTNLSPFIPHLPVSFLSNSVTVNYVNYKGTVFKVGSCVVSTADEENGLPIFSTVSYVLINDQENVVLLVKMLTTDYFDQHYHAYVVSTPAVDTFACIPINELFCPYPVILNVHNSLKMVTVHYIL